MASIEDVSCRRALVVADDDRPVDARAFRDLVMEAARGPIREPGASSAAFAALVRESNAGTQHWFLPTLEAPQVRLAGA